MTLVQASIFDAPAAERARDDAIEITAIANRPWVERALGAVKTLAAIGEPFTTDDVWRMVGDAPDERRAMGAVMRQAGRDRIVRSLNEWRLSERVECHRRPLRVWTRY